MGQLHLPIGRMPAGRFHGEVIALVSPMGLEFARVSASAQSLSGRYTDQAAGLWLAMLLDGTATLTDGGRERTLAPGEIVYAPTGVAATLDYPTGFRQLFVKAPLLATDRRRVALTATGVQRLDPAAAVNRLFAATLRATAEALDGLEPEQLRPMELAFTEFLIAGGAELEPAAGADPRAAHLDRVRRTVETLLTDPDLTLGRAAALEGVSPRYLQKLFAAAGESFTGYVRERRLERCRLDLASPRHAERSISELCYRWGFNSSAHFSRAFRDRYGVTPRDYRQGGGRA